MTDPAKPEALPAFTHRNLMWRAALHLVGTEPSVPMREDHLAALLVALPRETRARLIEPYDFSEDHAQVLKDYGEQARELTAARAELAAAHDRFLALGYEVADLRQAKDQLSEALDGELAENERLGKELAAVRAELAEAQDALRLATNRAERMNDERCASHAAYVSAEDLRKRERAARETAEKELAAEKEAHERTRVQLAGCGVAALGWAKGEQSCNPGDYGWSASFGDVLKLRENWEAEKEARRVGELERERESWKQSYRDVNEHRHEVLDELDKAERELAREREGRERLEATVKALVDSCLVPGAECALCNRFWWPESSYSKPHAAACPLVTSGAIQNDEADKLKESE